MASFEQCIQQRLDITAFQPESEEEIEEFIRILKENHKIIHQCASDADLKGSQYHSFIEDIELQDALYMLQEGGFYVLSSPEQQEILKRKVEGALRTGDWAHLSPADYSDDDILSFSIGACGTGGVVAGGLIYLLVEGGILVSVGWLIPATILGFGGGAILIGLPLAAFYVYLRE